MSQKPKVHFELNFMLWSTWYLIWNKSSISTCRWYDAYFHFSLSKMPLCVWVWKSVCNYFRKSYCELQTFLFHILIFLLFFSPNEFRTHVPNASTNQSLYPKSQYRQSFLIFFSFLFFTRFPPSSLSFCVFDEIVSKAVTCNVLSTIITEQKSLSIKRTLHCSQG